MFSDLSYELNSVSIWQLEVRKDEISLLMSDMLLGFEQVLTFDYSRTEAAQKGS